MLRTVPTPRPGPPSGGSVPGGNIQLSPNAPGYAAQQQYQLPQPPQTGGPLMAGGLTPPPWSGGGSAPGSPGSMPGTGGGFGAPGSAPGGGMTNNVDPSQSLKWLEDQYKSRLSNDPTQRAMDRSTSQIRDATTGLGKELGGNMSRRGISGSGIQKSDNIGLAQDAQRQIANASGQIALGRERDLDAMTMGGLGIMGAQDQLGLQKQQQGLNQWTAQNQAGLANARLGLDQWTAQNQMQLQANQQAQNGQTQLANLWSQYLNWNR